LVKLGDYLKPFLELVLAVILIALVPVCMVYFVLLLNLGVYSWIPIGAFITIVAAWFYRTAQKKTKEEYDELQKPFLREPTDEIIKEYRRLVEKNEE
jgi:hypothetical protein